MAVGFNTYRYLVLVQINILYSTFNTTNWLKLGGMGWAGVLGDSAMLESLGNGL
jgi:hypothetical protein